MSRGANTAGPTDGAKAEENNVTLAATGLAGLPAAKCAAVPNDGEFARLPAILQPLGK